MRKFEEPMVEVMKFDVEDIVSASSTDESTPGSTPAFVGPCL